MLYIHFVDNAVTEHDLRYVFEHLVNITALEFVLNRTTSKNIPHKSAIIHCEFVNKEFEEAIIGGASEKIYYNPTSYWTVTKYNGPKFSVAGAKPAGKNQRKVRLNLTPTTVQPTAILKRKVVDGMSYKSVMTANDRVRICGDEAETKPVETLTANDRVVVVDGVSYKIAATANDRVRICPALTANDRVRICRDEPAPIETLKKVNVQELFKSAAAKPTATLTEEEAEELEQLMDAEEKEYTQADEINRLNGILMQQHGYIQYLETMLYQQQQPSLYTIPEQMV